jgi:hypothetical protein
VTLLQEVGRDSVGATMLLPPEMPLPPLQVRYELLDEAPALLSVQQRRFLLRARHRNTKVGLFTQHPERNVFDLLQEVGRDSVGATMLLPPEMPLPPLQVRYELSRPTSCNRSNGWRDFIW